MSRPGITYDDVVNAAERLSIQGVNPTIESIRSITGTGSNGTIAPHLRLWKSRQTQAKEFSQKDELPEALMRILEDLWQRLCAQSNEKMIETKEALDQTITDLNEKNKQLEEESTRWQQQYHQTKREKEGLVSDKSALEHLIQRLENEKLALTIQHDAKIQQLQEKKENIKHLQANLEHYYEASREQRLTELQRSEQIQAQLEQSIKQLKQELTIVNQQKHMLQQEFEQIRYAKEIVQGQHDQLAVQHEAIKPRLEQTQQELMQHIQAEKHWQLQYQKVQDKLDEQSITCLNLQTQHAVLTQQLSDAQKELKVISDQNKFLASERWVLGQENAQLVGQLKQFEKLNLRG